jgi:hypothetical protein
MHRRGPELLELISGGGLGWLGSGSQRRRKPPCESRGSDNVLPINTTISSHLALLFREQRTGMDVTHVTPFQSLNRLH